MVAEVEIHLQNAPEEWCGRTNVLNGRNYFLWGQHAIFYTKSDQF